MAKHAPIPWHRDKGHIYSDDDKLIASCNTSEFTLEEDEVHAARILQAVNAHDKLVEALQGMVREARRPTTTAESGALADAFLVLADLGISQAALESEQRTGLTPEESSSAHSRNHRRTDS